MASYRPLIVWAGTAIGGVGILGTIAWRRAGRAPGQATIAIGPLPVTVAVSSRAHRAFVPHHGGTVDVLDTARRTLIRTVELAGPYGYGRNGIVVAEQTRRVFVAHAGLSSPQPMVSMLDARTGHALHTMPLGDAPDGASPSGMVVDERGGHILVGMGLAIIVLDARTGAVRRTVSLDSPGPISSVAADARAGRLFVGTLGVDAQNLIRMDGKGGGVYMLDLRGGGRILNVAMVDHEPLSMVVDVRLHRLFIPDKIGRVVSVLDTQSGQALRPITTDALGAGPDAIAVDTARGRLLVVANGDGVGTPASIGVFDARTGQLIRADAIRGTAWAIAVDRRAGKAYVSGTIATVAVDTRDALDGERVRVAGPGGGPISVDTRKGRLLIVRIEGASATALRASAVMADVTR